MLLSKIGSQHYSDKNNTSRRFRGHSMDTHQDDQITCLNQESHDNDSIYILKVCDLG